ncbi:hypothetical protein MUK42_21988 [Musa troglodytarum]|uniref:BHLH domain-containing protein n=1 Tax=Musa troglodytarum TaxID=320322 RepID=A0A9E7K860_9LILI|nr:hypothetical protein MUK42_21988 [Musa troglodytarum]URE10222.1 hypothetical protein MUK42_21988 [Musa troglodytarum]URE10223.1 hypothetical protein MUK42_21988 [Musa troglodytarum]
MENQIEVPYHMVHGYGGGEGCFFSGGDASAADAVNPALPWCLTSIHSISPAHHQFSETSSGQDQQLIMCPALPPFAPPLYGDLYNNRTLTGLQFPYDGVVDSPAGSTEAGSGVGFNRFLRAQGSASSSLFGTIHAELGRLTAQEIMDAKALAASKSHSEAERRRRERINGHLAKLRSMLPNTTKTDKASLLAEVIQHVKELKRQTSEITEESPLPTEVDELTVDSTCDEDGNFIVRASLCCEDRPDLLPDLINALKVLRLRVLKAEITTVGGRVKNVLAISEEQNSDDDDHQRLVTAIQEALKAVVEQTAKHDPSAGGTKRQRTASFPTIIEHSSI